MGITNFSISLLEKVIKEPKHKSLADYKPTSVVELGSQNMYTGNEYQLCFADIWYKKNGFTEYRCIDLAGDNNAWRLDLSKPLPKMVTLHGDSNAVTNRMEYDLVTDWGCGEHIVQAEEYKPVSFHGGHINSMYPLGVKNIEEGYYNCWLNKFNLCKNGGVIISENPKSGSWPSHGYSYLTMFFYIGLCEIADLEIIELGENAASGNNVDGWNIHCILLKTGNTFPSFEQFSELQIYKS
jgi:hypothetical protein